MAQFETAHAGPWPPIPDRLIEAGIRIDERGEEDRLVWCSCRRDRTSVGLTPETTKAEGDDGVS